MEGGVDPSCPEDRPYCIAGECGTCADGGEAFCAELDGAEECHPEWGRCVECVADTACAGQWCGNDLTCGGCTEHWQCPSSACDLERGRCMDDDLVIHVDNSVCPKMGSGTEAMPYCSLSTGVQQIGMGERGTIILHGTTSVYGDGAILTANAPRTIAIVGVDAPTIAVAGAGWAAVAGNDMHLYVSGTRLSSGTGSGVRCVGMRARLWLDDSTIYNNVDGLVVEDCVAKVRRTRIVNNDGYGVSITGENANVLLESSVVANNGMIDPYAGGLFVDAGVFDIRYTTIASNVSAQVGKSLRCVAGGGGPIRNSILVAAELDSVDCPWAEISDSVHDTPAMPGSDNEVVEMFDEGWFQNPASADFHVRRPTMSIFRDRAQWQLGDPTLDLDREPRPAYPEAVGFAGADQP